jgi:DNA-binding transcriptional MerR regulator
MTPPAIPLSLVTEIYGLSKESLLAYEAEGLVLPLKVGNNRYYPYKERIKIEIILKGRKLGFSLQEIKQIISAITPDKTTKTQG